MDHFLRHLALTLQATRKHNIIKAPRTVSTPVLRKSELLAVFGLKHAV